MTLTRSPSPGNTRLPVKLEAVLVRLCRGRHDEAYLRMTPEYQKMAQTIESLNFESMLVNSTPMESPDDVLN